MPGIWDITSTSLEKALEGTVERQSVLANNIANLSTPGFKRSDVSFQDQLKSALDSGDPSRVDAVQPVVVTDNSVGQANGNNVSLDQEMTDVAQNQLESNTYESLLHDRIAMLKTVLNNGRG